jgi:hypothetical protein
MGQQNNTRRRESEAIMEVRFFLTGQDVWNFQKYALRRTRSLLIFGALFVVVIALLLLTAIFSRVSDTFSNPAPFVVVLFFLLLLLLLLRIRTRSMRGRHLAVQGEHIITIGPEGFRHRTNVTDALISWRALKTITSDKHNLYFIVISDRLMGHVIPRRAFPTPQDAEAFLGWARTCWAQGPAVPPGGPAGSSTTYERWS